MFIGELSKATGVPVRTIRYYEQIGLLPEPERTATGYRVFGDQHVQLARFIRRSRGLGFGLDQIRSILQVKTDECSPCDSVRSTVHQNIQTIDQRIAELTAMREALGRTLERLDSVESRIGHNVFCPVVESQARLASVISLDSPLEWKV